MALLTKVGSFVKPGATGAQAITGVGFQPKVIIIWSPGSPAASGVWNAHIRQSLGFAAAGVPITQFCVAGLSDDNQSSSNTARRMAAKVITNVNSSGVGVNSEADLQSFDADGFTLNWTTNDASNFFHYMYLALGGSDITGAKVVNWQQPAAVGNKAVTGVGFKPDLVLHAGLLASGPVPVSVVHHYIGFGAMNKHGQQWANSVMSFDNVSPSNTARFQQTDACIAESEAGGTLVQAQAHYVSMDADGFTTYFSSQISGREHISLCLQGVSSKLGAFAKTTAAAPAQQGITRVGFQPKSVLFSSITRPASAAPFAAAKWMMGVSDGINHRVTAQGDQDNANPTQANSIWNNAQALIGSMDETVPSVLAQAALTTFDSDGFTLTWNPNDTWEMEQLYLALGDAGVDTFPVSAVTEL